MTRARATGAATPDAVLFDCDGTLLDSETVTVRAMRRALGELGHTLTEAHVAAMVGHPWPATRALLVELFDLTDRDLLRYGQVMQRTAGPLLRDPTLVFDDVLDVLDELAAHDVPLAVVTSSSRSHLDRVLSLPPLAERFCVRVAREDVAEHKPSPVPYLTALEQLRAVTGRPLQDVAVVEDSHAGVAAGVAAGCWTVAVDRGADLHDLDHADLVVTTLQLHHLTP